MNSAVYFELAVIVSTAVVGVPLPTSRDPTRLCGLAPGNRPVCGTEASGSRSSNALVGTGIANHLLCPHLHSLRLDLGPRHSAVDWSNSSPLSALG